MPAIGDLYWVFRGDGARLKADAKKFGEEAGDVGGKGFTKKFGGSVKQGLMGGLGLGAGLGLVNLASTAVSEFTQVLGDSITAAQEEEKSVAKLGAALQANIPDWDGNTKAIEDALAARMRLGFADDEQRESLATLVAVTKDATKALELQRTAMDLARLRNIDLAAASDIVGKVYGGNIGILSRYGIQVRKGATATEALAELTKLAGGQAEAYANTAGGKMLKAQIAIGEAMEKFGGVILPFVADAAGAVADTIDDVTAAVSDLGGAAKDNADPMGNLSNLLYDLTNRGEESRTALGAVEEGLSDLVNDVGRAVGGLIDDSADLATFWDGYTAHWDDANARALDSTTALSRAAALRTDEIASSYDNVGDKATETKRRVGRANHQMAESFVAWRDRVIGAAQEIVDKAYQIIEDKSALVAANVEKDELRKVIATGKATAEQKARFVELTGEQARLVLSLAENGAEGQKVVTDTIKQLKKDLAKATGNERKAIQATIDALDRLLARTKLLKKQMAALASLRANVNAGSEQGIGGNWAPPGKASGGPVMPGHVYMVGEERPELFVPKVPGHIFPSVEQGIKAIAPTTMAGSNTTISLQTYGLPMRASTPAEVVAQLRRATRVGLAPAVPRASSWKR